MGGHGRVIRNIVALLVNQVGTWSVTLVITLVLPPYLGPAHYGLYAFVGSYVGLFALGMNLGTGTYLTWRIAREPEDAGRLTFNTLILQLPLALLSGLLALLILPSLDNHPLVSTLTVIWAVGATASALTGTLNAALAGFQLLRVPARLALMTLSVSAVLIVLGVALHADLVFLATAGLASQCIGFVAVLAYAQRKIGLRPRVDLRLWRTIVLGGLPFFGWSAALLVYGQIDISMLKVMAGNAQVGWYSAAYRIISVPVFLPTIVISALLPALSSERVFDSAQFRTLASRSIRLVAAVGIPACAGTILLAQGLLKVLHYPSTFDPATPLIVILALHMPVVGLDMVLATVIIAIGRQRAWTVVGIIAAIFNPLMNLWAIPYTWYHYGNGAIGAAVVTVLTELLTLAGALVLRPRTVFTRGDVFYIFRCMLAAGVMVPTVLALAALPRVGVLPAVAYGVLIYTMAAYTLQVVRNEDFVALARVFLGHVGAGNLADLNFGRVCGLVGLDHFTHQSAVILRRLQSPVVLLSRLVIQLMSSRAAREVSVSVERPTRRDTSVPTRALDHPLAGVDSSLEPIAAAEVGLPSSANGAASAGAKGEHALAGVGGERIGATGGGERARLTGVDTSGDHERTSSTWEAPRAGD